MKAATAAAGGLSGVGLQLVGYNAKLEVQSAGTVMGIRIMMIIVPILLGALSYFIYNRYYILKGEKMAQITEKLNQLHQA